MSADPKPIRHIIYGGSIYPRPKPTRYLETQLTANLTLQKLLYFNTYYSMLFFYLSIGINAFRLWVMKATIIYVIKMVLLLLWGILEVFRIQNGYSGNIKEQFPELFSFVLISIMSLGLQIVGIIEFMPAELALVIIQLIFYVLEMLLAIISMCTKSKSQVALLSLRVPQQESDYLIKKEIEHLKIEANLGMRNQVEEQE